MSSNLSRAIMFYEYVLGNTAHAAAVYDLVGKQVL